jgi:two-component system chemotaxis response regulator CheY
MLVRNTISDCEIAEAADEASALARFAEKRPDLVMLDINLVGSSGLSVLKRLRAMDPDVVIVMLTAVGTRHTMEEALANGANSYILKEADFEQMAAALREVLEEVNEGQSGDNPA